jgi:hypothetical protein
LHRPHQHDADAPVDGFVTALHICLDIETVPDRGLIPEWPKDKFPPKSLSR